MDKFEERSKRELLGGLRTILKALEPGGGFSLRQRGEVVNELQAAIVRREIAYLESAAFRLMKSIIFGTMYFPSTIAARSGRAALPAWTARPSFPPRSWVSARLSP
jgi:ABC-type iron transport system FetAB ATPase subunit